MATDVEVLTVGVSVESPTFDSDLALAIQTAILDLGSPFDTSFDIVSITPLPGGGRAKIAGDSNEAKTVKLQRYTVIVQA